MTWPLIRDRAFPRFPPVCMRTEALRGWLESRGVLPVMLEQLVTDLVEIVGQDPKSDIPLKPRPAFVGTPIQSMVFQGIDVRLNTTVLSS